MTIVFKLLKPLCESPPTVGVKFSGQVTLFAENMVKDESFWLITFFPHLCGLLPTVFALIFVMRGFYTATLYNDKPLCVIVDGLLLLSCTVWSCPALTFIVTWGRVALLFFLTFHTNVWASWSSDVGCPPQFLTPFTDIFLIDLNQMSV